MSNEDPWGDGSLTVTLKAGKGYEAAWIVVKGADAATVRKHLEEATGLSGEGLTLAQLTYNASYHFQSINTVAHGLDAIVIPDEEVVAATRRAAKAEPTPEPEPEKAPEVDLKAEIEKRTSRADLQDLFLKNKDAFNSDKALMAALQARFTAKDVA